MKKRIAAVLIALALVGSSLAALSGCGNGQDAAVAVQSVSLITGVSGTAVADKYAGVVVSSNVLKIEKGTDQKVTEIKVKVGDEVCKGDILFSYDQQSLKLAYEKLLLEKEQYTNLIATMKQEIEELKKKVTGGSSATQLEYSIQLQTRQIDLKEAEYKMTTMDADIEAAKAMLSNADYKSTVDGRVQSINESGTDSSGAAAPFMTIVETGAFRVEGRISELNVDELNEGARVIIRSRSDKERIWRGTVDEIKFDDPDSSENSDTYYGDSGDSMTTASKYPFFVRLDDATGLILGQHVFVEADLGQENGQSGMWLPSFFICDIDTTPYVWIADSRDRLRRSEVELGAYDDVLDTYEILSGLTAEDYVAFPSEECAEGVKVERFDENSFTADSEGFDDGDVSGGDYISYDDGYSEDEYDEYIDGEGAMG